MTWTAPMIDRPDTDINTDEGGLARSWLAFHRATLLWKCSGLTGEQLTTASVEPSGMTLLGLVRHMAEVERWWFRRAFAGEDLTNIYCTEEHQDGDFDLVTASSAPDDVAAYRAECELADKAVAGRGMDETCVTRRGTTMNLRWIYTHMIEEYARHNGHADLIRERIDGATGD